MLALAKSTNKAKFYQTILFWYVLNKAGKCSLLPDWADRLVPKRENCQHSLGANQWIYRTFALSHVDRHVMLLPCR